MNEELIIKYLDGTATAEEEAKVEAEMKSDPSLAAEMIEMAAAARLSGTSPIEKVSLFNAKCRVSDALSESRKRKSLFAVVASFSAVACCALILGLTIWNSNSSEQDLISENIQKTADIPTCEIVLPPVIHDDSAGFVMTESSDENTSGLREVPIQIIEKKQATAKNVGPAMSLFKMIRPSRTPYRVLVKDIGKNFCFRWQKESVSSMVFSIVDANDSVLFCRSVCQSIDSVNVALSVVTDKGELEWKVNVGLDGNDEEVYSGKIEFISRRD